MISEQLYMAPVRGITDIIYRNVFQEHFGGIDRAITPFITTVKGNQIKKSQRAEFIPTDNRIPIIPQIIGKNAGNFITLAKTLYELGNKDVNWNLGCPHPTMTKKKCGSGLIAQADLIDRFLDTVCNEIPNRLSIKVRLGLQDKSELKALIPLFNKYPITELTIHPRTGVQMYKGEVDLNMFELYMKQLEVPVIYNGDIYTLDDFNKLNARFPTVNKWMLGRGLFSNPLLAQEIKSNSLMPVEEKYQRVMDFADELLRFYKKRLFGEAHLVQRMVSHWEYLHHSIPQGKKRYKQMRRTKSTQISSNKDV